MESILSLCLGLGLSAACGLRVFVPLLFLSLASASGHVSLAPAFQWIGTTPALVAFAAATILEIAGYCIPWVDHFLDTVATPAAVVAGTIITASMVTEMSPLLKWTLAIIAGGGAAGVIQTTTVLLRGASTATTGGLANPVLAAAELGGSIVTSVVALVAPVLGIVLLMLAVIFGVRKVIQLRARQTAG